MFIIKIPTNFETKDEMMNMLSKQIGRSKIFYNYKSRIWTEIKPDNTLVLTSDGKRFGAYEFIGEIYKEEDTLFLKGYVQKREDIQKRQKIYSIMMSVMAIILFMTLNVVFIFMGTLFIIVTLINWKLIKDETPFIKFLEKNVQK